MMSALITAALIVAAPFLVIFVACAVALSVACCLFVLGCLKVLWRGF